MMHKKIIAALIAAALVPATAIADNKGGKGVKIGGLVNVEYTGVKIDQSTASGGGGSDANNRYQKAITDPALFSQWYLAAQEDLGDGLSAIARVEFRIATGAGVPEQAAEQWVGLSSKRWGTLRFGSVGSPFRDFAGGASVDRFIGTGLELRGAGGAQYSPVSGLGTSNIVDHALTYISPTMNGISLAVLLSPVDATQTDPTLANTNQRNPNTGGRGNGVDYQIAVKYSIPKYGDVFAGYSHDSANDNQKAFTINGKTASAETVWRIGANLKFDKVGLYGQYDRISDAHDTFSAPLATASGSGAAGCAGSSAHASGGDAGVSTQQCNNSLNTNGDGTIWNLGVSYTLGKTLLVLQGGRTKADAVGTAVERTATNVTLGAIYNFSKTTRAYAGYQHVNVEGARTISQISRAATIGGAPLAVQPDRSVYSIGMRKVF